VGVADLRLLLGVQEYRIHNADLLFKEDSTVDDLIDVIEVRRRRAEGQRA
jgi:ribosome-interacting GTPase 1